MIDDPKLLQFLQSEEARATDETLNSERAVALEMYRGDPFGDETEGLSQLRTRDVAEVVDYMCVSILRTMCSGDRIVEFEPRQQGQDEFAQEATERVHWNFLREQDGYSILHDGVKAGLIEKSGVWKSWAQKSFRHDVVVLNAMQLEQAEQQDSVVVAAKPIEDAYDIDESDPAGPPLALYEVTLRVPGQTEFRDAAIPNEQFFYSPDTRAIDSSPYCGDWSRQSLADLIDMGYPEDEVADLWSDNGSGQSLSDTRDAKRGGKDSDAVRSDLGRVVVLREEYCHWQVEGRYRLVRVHRVLSRILSVEPVESRPYTVWSPFPMPHRLIGDSLADKTMDIQVVRSHMLRQAMDALYLANRPRYYVDMTQTNDMTLDDTLDVAVGAVIRGQGQNAVSPIVTPFAAGPAFQALEIMAGEKESRTGITRLNQGLDADTLNKTATGTALMQAQGQQIEEYVARNAANAIGELFEKKLRLMIAEMQPHDFRIDGEFRQIDPAQWPADMRFSVRVGLGSGNKDKRLQGIVMLKEAQAEARMVDPRMVTPEKAFATAKLLTSTLGLGLATQFFEDPAKLAEQEPRPDPAMVEAQAKAQQAQQQMQFDQQAAAAKMQSEQQMAAFKLQAQRESDAATLQAMRERQAAELQLARDKAVAEATLAEEQMNREFALESARMERQFEMDQRRADRDVELAKKRPGGDLDK